MRWVDAGNGLIRKAFNALTDGASASRTTPRVDLRPAAGGGFELASTDGRRITFDAASRQVRGTLMFDADDHWTLTTPNYTSPTSEPVSMPTTTPT